jgi:nucleotide-binding universal stress UspA family protein
MNEFKTILVPTDFSPASMRAIDEAIGLAAVLDSEILVVHVVMAPQYPFGFGDGSLPAIREELTTAVKQHLEKVVAGVRARGARARGLLRSGHVQDVLTSVIDEERPDLVVLTTHGYSGFKHMMLGSVAERIVRSAPCPVLVVPPEST